mmetsp:Transcript_2435/g.3197  ORF Transcript_2435/g.3197 Transcript_2435/m.3197 type:complete len:184 (-) Transcript_2435:10-561(-)
MQSDPVGNVPSPNVWDSLSRYGILYQRKLDESVPWIKARWGLTGFLFFLYVLRVTTAGGWYIVSYALGIYLLNLLIGFLSPQIDPELLETDEDNKGLPTTSDDEFKPFIRRVPEFKFWYSMSRAIVISLVCTMFPFLDIPVFWPILLIYFIALFVITMKKQIKHMIKHHYIPFNVGKPKYSGK